MTNKIETDEEKLLTIVNNEFGGDMERFKNALKKITKKNCGRPLSSRDQDALFFITVEIIILNIKPRFEHFLWEVKKELALTFRLKVKQDNPPPLAKKKTIREAISIVMASGEFSSATPDRFENNVNASIYGTITLEDQLLRLYKKMKREAKDDVAWLDKTFSELIEESD